MRHAMTPWKCEDCGKRYSCKDFNKLMKADKHMHCECGYIFTHGRWSILDYVQLKNFGKIGEVKVRISTIYCEMFSSDNDAYETMIFPENDHVRYESEYRYSTREDAEAGHKKIVELFQASKFDIISDGELYRIRLRFGE